MIAAQPVSASSPSIEDAAVDDLLAAAPVPESVVRPRTPLPSPAPKHGPTLGPKDTLDAIALADIPVPRERRLVRGVALVAVLATIALAVVEVRAWTHSKATAAADVTPPVAVVQAAPPPAAAPATPDPTPSAAAAPSSTAAAPVAGTPAVAPTHAKHAQTAKPAKKKPSKAKHTAKGKSGSKAT